MALTAAAVVLAGGGAFAAVTASSSGSSTLLADDFSGGMAHWKTSGGAWKVTPAGRLQQSSATRSARVVAGSSTWTDYALQSRVQPNRFTADGAFVGISARATGSSSYTRLVLVAAGRAEVQVVTKGKVAVAASDTLTIAPGKWHTLRLEAQGTMLRGYVDGTLVTPSPAGASATASTSGWIGLDTSRATAQFDNVTVASLSSGSTDTPTPDPSVSAGTPSTAASTASTPTTTPTTTTSAGATTTPTTTTSAGANPGPAAEWNPPANLSAALAKVWSHEETTYGDLYGFKNYLWDQIIAAKGNINYCVRWESTASVTAAQRDQVQAQLQRQFQKWMDALTENGKGWDQWPYPTVNVKVVGWAVKDRALLKWTDNSVDVYVNNLDSDGIAQCAPPCGRFFQQNNDYSGCPGGADHHYDLSLWLTQGDTGGTGGDWGERIGSEYYMNNLTADNVHILLHEMGHGYGLDDFYDWDPGVGGFIMMAGSAAQITPFDQWMLRDWWRHLKSRYSL